MSLRTIIAEACRGDNVVALKSILEANQYAITTSEIQLSAALKCAIHEHSLQVLEYLLEFGVNLTSLAGSDVYSKGPLKPILHLLLSYGWDINTRSADGPDRQPILWRIVRDTDLVNWCLDHGARVRVAEGYNHFSCLSLLEVAAVKASVATFELLRGRGADLGPRTLHLAAQHAVSYTTDAYADVVRQSESYKERINMVRYLLNTLELDVNAWDREPGVIVRPLHFGTPLNYVAEACWKGPTECRDITWMLLDAGADLTKVQYGRRSALDLPLDQYAIRFVEAIEQWQERRSA